MKKMHDQLLRNIYELAFTKTSGNGSLSADVVYQIVEETKKSRALPAHCYELERLTKLQTIYEIAYNGYSNSLVDIMLLVEALTGLFDTRSFKQMRMPVEAYDYLKRGISEFNYALKAHSHTFQVSILQDLLVYIKQHFTYEIFAVNYAKLKAEHPEIDNLYKLDTNTAENRRLNKLCKDVRNKSYNLSVNKLKYIFTLWSQLIRGYDH